MANPQVEMLKALGLRHGEKAVVGISGFLCLTFLRLAGMKETIKLTPDEVDANAKKAQTNLSRKQDESKIIEKIESDGIKNVSFEKIVNNQAKEVLSPDTFKASRLWVTNEPGAGMIRDTPLLIAPNDLYAYPGRGGAAVFVLDDEGERVKADENDKIDEQVVVRRKKKKKRGQMGGMGGMMGGAGKKGNNSKGRAAANRQQARLDAEKKAAEEKKRLSGALVGEGGEEKEEKKEEETKEGVNKEATKGLHWVVITGVLDNKKMKQNWLNALKIASVAYPHYRQIEVQRQVRNFDGSWPEEWEEVDSEKNQAISYNLPETEDELAPDDVIIPALVDPLPFLKAGYWERVHVARLVPKDKREIKEPAGGINGMMGGPGGASGMMGGGMMGGGMMGGGRGRGGRRCQRDAWWWSRRHGWRQRDAWWWYDGRWSRCQRHDGWHGRNDGWRRQRRNRRTGRSATPTP